MDLIRPFIEMRVEDMTKNNYRGYYLAIQERIKSVGVDIPKVKQIETTQKTKI